MVTETLAPESICALGESKSRGSDTGEVAVVFAVGVVASEETEIESSSVASVSESIE